MQISHLGYTVSETDDGAVIDVRVAEVQVLDLSKSVEAGLELNLIEPIEGARLKVKRLKLGAVRQGFEEETGTLDVVVVEDHLLQVYHA